MRLLAFSDWRTQDLEDILDFVRNQEPSVDLVLYAGDDIERFYEEGRNYFKKIASYVSERKVLAVAGNDDLPECQMRVMEEESIHNLHKDALVLGNFAFIGLEGATSGPGFLIHSESKVKDHLEEQYLSALGKQIVVLSHVPPYGILDFGIRFAPPENGTHHIGSKALRNFISRYKVHLVVCGHSHSQGGRFERFKNATILNISSHDHPGAEGKLALIELQKTGAPLIEIHTTSEYIARGSLYNLQGVGACKKSQLETVGIGSINDLIAVKDFDSLAKRCHVSEIKLRELQLRAISLVEKRTFRIAPISLNSDNLLFFDIETDIACQKVWLIGILKNDRFHRFYAHDWSEERNILKQFMDFLKKIDSPTLISYSGTSFDRRVILQALKRHGMNAQIFSYLPHIDLAQLIRRGFVLPTTSLRLKNLGLYLGFEFRHKELDGLALALKYHQHLIDGRPLGKDIFEYNEDDVRALRFIIDRLFNNDQIENRYISWSMPRPLEELSESDRLEIEEMYELRKKGYNLRELVHILGMPAYNIYDKLARKSVVFMEEETIFMIREFYESDHGRLSIRKDKRWNSYNVGIRFNAKTMDELYTLRNAMANLGFSEGTPYISKSGNRCMVPYYGKNQTILFMRTVRPRRKNDISVLLGEVQKDHERKAPSPLLPLGEEAIAIRKQKLMKTLAQKYSNEYHTLKSHISRVPVDSWPELLERCRKGTICLSCFRKGYDWKKTVIDRRTGEIICATCGEVLRNSHR